MQLSVVKRLSLVARKLGEGDGGQVANRYFILTRVLQDLRAQVRALDRSKILLVALTIAGIFVEHVWGSSLDLRVNDLLPEPAGFHLLAPATLLLILSVKGLELFTPALEESWALVGAHKGPISVGLHSLHEEIWDPEGIEEVPSTVLLRSIVLAKLEELVDIRMPWLEVDGKGALTLATALIDVPCGIIEDFEHGHESVGIAVRASDV